MDNVIFDGRAAAATILSNLKDRLTQATEKPKIAIIFNPDDTGSKIYASIKTKKAEELGVEVLNISYPVPNLEILLEGLNKDGKIDGIMIQLPLTGDRQKDVKLCGMINPAKDVDGLNPSSGVMPATVRAVAKIIDLAINYPVEHSDLDMGRLKNDLAGRKMLVVGSRGTVGSALVKLFGCEGIDRENFDMEKIYQADILITATGQEALIKPDMVKDGAIVIDVGYPKGDVDAAAAAKSAFFTPVPGGVGPMTVAMLFSNLVEMQDKQKT